MTSSLYFVFLATGYSAVLLFLVWWVFRRRRAGLASPGRPTPPEPDHAQLARSHALENGWLPEYTNHHREVFEVAHLARQGVCVDEETSLRLARLTDEGVEIA